MKDYHNSSDTSTTFPPTSSSRSNGKTAIPFPCGFGQLPDTPQFKRLIGKLPKAEICILNETCSSRNHRIPGLTSYPLSDKKIAEQYGLAPITVAKARRSLTRKGIIAAKKAPSGKYQCTLHSDYLRDQKQEKTSQTGCENILNRMRKHPKQDENSASKNGSNPHQNGDNGTYHLHHPDSYPNSYSEPPPQTPPPLTNGNGKHALKNGKNEGVCKDLKDGEKPKAKNKARNNADLIKTFAEYTGNPPEDDADSKMDTLLNYVYDTFENRYHGVDFPAAAREITHLAITKYLPESDAPVRFVCGIHETPMGKTALRSAFDELNPRQQTDTEVERQRTRDYIAECRVTGKRPTRNKRDNWTNLSDDPSLAEIAQSNEPQIGQEPAAAPEQETTQTIPYENKRATGAGPAILHRNPTLVALRKEQDRIDKEQAIPTPSARNSRADVSDEDEAYILDQDAAD